MWEERSIMTTSTADDLYQLAKSLPVTERLRLVEKIAHDLTVAGPPSVGLTAAELVSLLSSLPQADDGYAADVERAVRSQGEVPRSSW
jgi:hypothetical protein